MISALSIQEKPMLSHLIGGLTLVLFLGWFALPSCHCQWNSIFGCSQDFEESSVPAIQVGSPISTDQSCQCDDHPTKIFEVADAPDLSSPFPLHFVATPMESQHPGPLRSPCDALTRGPPPAQVHHQAEPRAYLRHRSLLL